MNKFKFLSDSKVVAVICSGIFDFAKFVGAEKAKRNYSTDLFNEENPNFNIQLTKSVKIQGDMFHFIIDDRDVFGPVFTHYVYSNCCDLDDWAKHKKDILISLNVRPL